MMRYIFILIAIILIGNLEAYDIMKTGKTNDFLVLHDVEVKKEPTEDSETLIKLGIFDEVKKLSVTNIGKKLWLYIDTIRGYDDTIRGWVPKSSIIQISQFKPIYKFNEYYITGGAGDYEFSVQFYTDGTFIMYSPEDEYKYTYKKGRIYRYKNLVIAGWEYFYIDENGVLKSWMSDEEGNKFYSKAKRGPFYNLKNKIPFTQMSNSISTETYHILTGDNVNVRAEATTNSRVLLQLKKGAKVKVLERSDVEFTVGDASTGSATKGYWVYIDTGVKDKKGKTIKGWVVDIYFKQEE